MLLNIKHVKFKNFFSFGAKWQNLELKEGTNLVIGYDQDNDRRNGAGKSSLLDAIVFGLFGRTAKDVTLPRIPNWKNKRGCEVHIEFEKNGVLYRIERGLKPGFIRLYKNGSEVEQVSHKSDFQTEIEKDHIGIDFDTFMSLIHCNPNTNISIFNVSKGQKRAFIEKLFGLETFSNITKKANEKLASIDRRVTDISKIIDFNKKNISTLELQNVNFEDSIRKLVSYRKEIRDLEKKLENVDDKIISLTEKHKEKSALELLLSMQATDVSNILTNIEKKSYGLTQKIKSISVDVDSKKEKEIKKQIEELKKVPICNCNRDEVKKDMIAATLNLTKYTTLRDALPDITSLKDKCECPTCLSSVNYNVLSAKHNELQSTYTIEIKILEGQIEGYNLILRTEEKYRKAQEEIKDLETKLAAIEIEKSKLVKKALYEKIIEKYGKLKKKLQAKLDKLNKSMEEIDEKLSTITADINDLTNKKKQLDELKQKEKIQQDQKSEFGSYIEANDVKIQEYKKEIVSVEKEKKQLSVMEDYLEYIKTLCKDENVKQFAIANIIPFVNQQVNSYLAEAGFNFYVKLDNWLDIEIKGPGIDNSSYGNLSGGESKSVNLALQLAFLDVCKLHSAVFPNVLLLDEILDSAIDSYGIQRMMSIIKHKQQVDDLKVYIVSHRKEINEIESDRIYQITKSKGFSTINEVA